ncbi:hypothetical protein KA111_00430 [Candidatus Woesebacteria bacterium]|nr:hypothetical protein [Candidatus Woesebacteria bacterium]
MAFRELPLYGTLKAKDLITRVRALAKNLKNPKHEYIKGVLGIKEYSEPKQIIDIEDSNLFSIDYSVISKLKEKEELTDEIKLTISTIILYLPTNKKDEIIKAKSMILSILDKIKHNENNVEWLYKELAKNLTKSQLEKILKINDLKIDLNKIKSNQKIEIINPMLNMFTDLSTSKTHNAKLNKGDSTTFLGLDNSGKEAACWQKLEMKKSNNIDYARLAGYIAWRTWLFKKPLLKEYCRQKKLDYGNLNFSQRAKLTKEAVQKFSKDEMATILNSYIEKELHKRKKLLGVENRQAFINKRATLGLELEIGELPFETAAIYAWYENLDRNSEGDSLAQTKDVNQLFKKLSIYRDENDLTINLNYLFAKTVELAGKIINEKKDESDDTKFKDELIALIKKIPKNGDQPKSFISWLSKNKVSKPFLGAVLNHIRQKIDYHELLKKKAKFDFDDLVEINPSDSKNSKYISQYSSSGRMLENSHPEKKHILYDIFRHHMGQAQIFGHGIGSDAYGEYQIDYTRPNLKNPSRVNLRQNFELAEAAFHDLDLEEKPIHATVGWKEDFLERKIKVEESVAERIASIINFALITTGWTERKTLEILSDQIKKLTSNQKISISEFKITGNNVQTRLRADYTSEIIYGCEFRGFSPNKKDLVRLLQGLGNLGTLMKAKLASIFFEKSNNNASFIREIFEIKKIDKVDKKLALIWDKFEAGVLEIYNQFENIPPLNNANLWNTTGVSKTQLTNYYLKIAEDLEKPDGVVAQMRKLIAETTKEIEAVFAG